MIPKETIRKIRRIQITTSRKVTDVFAGQYQSVFKGVGMEFDEVREYTPGDEIRSIDWNVTARMGHPYIKKFVEERELTIMILLDVSMSCRFGTRGRMKSELAAELCSVIAFSAIKNNDKVGMLTFTDRVEKFVPPRKGMKHVLRVIREALHNRPAGTHTDINKVLNHLNKVAHRRAIVFLVSDFYSDDFRKTLSITNKKHDVIAVTVEDPSEAELTNAGLLELRDAETGLRAVVDTSSPAVRDMFRRENREIRERARRLFRSVNVDHIELSTDRSYVEPLIRFFRTREKRFIRR
ncbi:MAG: DUF58 domain-containing protein [Candidatus Omnitrophica bacterium]|nr:DUF58 domain-containing protein [Candidatus Omnitrophota bacterium]MDD5487522.1 DUF58 domain-containing protein [Candidatus Omnitrophota bacterium]